MYRYMYMYIYIYTYIYIYISVVGAAAPAPRDSVFFRISRRHGLRQGRLAKVAPCKR